MTADRKRPTGIRRAHALGRRLITIPIVALVTLPLWSPRVKFGPQGTVVRPGAMSDQLAVVLYGPSFMGYLLFLIAIIGIMYFWLFVRPYTVHGLGQRLQALEDRFENIEEAVTEPQPATSEPQPATPAPPPLPRYWRGE